MRDAAVHSALPEALAHAAGAVLGAAGVAHVAHGDGDPVAAAEAAAADPRALALLGPFRSAHVAEAVEASAPARLALLAPVATWAGITHDDEPGCDDAARHDGTVLRMVARDTEVAARIAADVRAAGLRALVVAGGHEYGVQLDGQLRLAGLPRAETAEDADLVVLCGLVGEAEMRRAAALAPLPVVAFDGVQGGDLGPRRDVLVALPFGPEDADAMQRPERYGIRQTRRAAELVVAALDDGAADRGAMLASLRALGPFDAHGDPVGAPVWLWRAGTDGRCGPSVRSSQPPERPRPAQQPIRSSSRGRRSTMSSPRLPSMRTPATPPFLRSMRAPVRSYTTWVKSGSWPTIRTRWSPSAADSTSSASSPSNSLASGSWTIGSTPSSAQASSAVWRARTFGLVKQRWTSTSSAASERPAARDWSRPRSVSSRAASSDAASCGTASPCRRSQSWRAIAAAA
jgi:hypothetical protein